MVLKVQKESQKSSTLPDISQKVGDVLVDKAPTKKKKRKRQAVGICTTACRYDSIRRAAKIMGFAETDDQGGWTIYWTDCSVSLERCMAMKTYQRINHFPGMAEICRKDLLSRNLTRLYKLFPKEYAIFPRTWVLPADNSDFLAYMRGRKRTAFICKPQSGCQGKGIFLTRRPHKDLKSTDRYIVQHYISKPLLIDSFKFDLRIYALVTSCDPLRVYIFNEGLARFATKPYSDPVNSNLDESMMHLTNYSINKHSDDFVQDAESGSKRKFSSVNHWLRSSGYNVEKIWSEIDDVVVKTLIAAHPVLQHNYRTCFPTHNMNSACFEILGFDVMIDRKMKVWLLEVNHSPSFHTDSKMDKEIKDQLLVDTFKILHVRATDKQHAVSEGRRATQQRLTQLAKSNTNITASNRNHRLTASETLKDRLERSKELKSWECKHLGGFRCVYPTNAEKDPYKKFFEITGSFYQTTASTQAREEAVRLQRVEFDKKSKAEIKADAGESSRPKTTQSTRKPMIRIPLKKTMVQANFDTSELSPIEIINEEECDRVTQIQSRGLLHCTNGTTADTSRMYQSQQRYLDYVSRSCLDNSCPAKKHGQSGGGETRILLRNNSKVLNQQSYSTKPKPVQRGSVLRQKSFPFMVHPSSVSLSTRTVSAKKWGTKNQNISQEKFGRSTSSLSIRACSRPTSDYRALKPLS